MPPGPVNGCERRSSRRSRVFLLSALLLPVLMTQAALSGPLSRIEIHQGWAFRSARGVTWHPASVPGVVHTDLMAAGIIEDPFVRMNERACQWVDKEDWEYKTSFDVPEEMLRRQSLRLVFRGLDTYADVSLNGQKVLAADKLSDPTRRARFEHEARAAPRLRPLDLLPRPGRIQRCDGCA